jgi:putative hydroxymethylpyrimidine transport system substrate-binding protein
MTKKLGLTATAVALVLGLAACGEKKETVSGGSGHGQSLSVMLDWFPNADHVGIYAAMANGDFERAGLNVHVQVPSDPSSPLKLLAAGKVDVAITYEPELFLARDQNLPLASIAAIVQEPLTSIVSIGSKHIKAVSDLRGKTVGDAGIPYQHAYLSTILARAGIPQKSVKEVNVGSDLLPAMLSRRVDATLGAYWNYEAVQLRQMGKRPNVIRMNQVGVPNYDELVLAVRTSTLSEHQDEIRRFVQALARGYKAVQSNPKAAVQSLVSRNPGLDPKLQLASVKATLPAFFPSSSGQPWGWQDQSQWNAYGEWMLSHHLISNPSAVANASTNQVLAGQGV